MTPNSPAFLTGSHVYGTPHENSDIDLVCYATPETARRLAELAGHHRGDSSVGQDGETLRFGKLNLLVITTEDKYLAWRDGTRMLEERRPVSRDAAVGLFQMLFNEDDN